ncbi:putative carbamoyl-phosphate synthase, small subunit, partial [Opisthorchis viverrini]
RSFGDSRPLGRLELHDGTVYDGFLYGSCGEAAGEVVFQTGMVGYIESLTDPSYHSQLLVLTYPSIGTVLGRIYPLPRGGPAPEWFDPASHNLVSHVSCREEKIFNSNGDVHVAVVDCGVKFNQIRCFCRKGAKVTLLPSSSDLSARINEFDALFISNGPGDPSHCTNIVDQIRQWMKSNKPLFGICLGHQLVARAVGLETYKMKYGNRGHNQPCIHLETKRCFITS